MTATVPDSLPGPEVPGGPGMPPEPPSRPGGPPPADPQSNPRTALWVVAGLAVVVLVVALVVLAWPRHRHKAVTRVLPPPQAIVGAGGRELISLLQTGQRATFHATYRVVGGPPGGVQSLEIWQSPPRVREDTVAAANGHTARTASISQGTTTHLCIQRDGGPWTCQGSAIDPNNIVATIAGSVAGQPVAVTETTINNRKVQCFQIGSGAQLCATSSGIPVLIASSSVRYELVTLSSSVNAADLNPPAADSK
jgi:hypothetical protein